MFEVVPALAWEAVDLFYLSATVVEDVVFAQNARSSSLKASVGSAERDLAEWFCCLVLFIVIGLTLAAALKTQFSVTRDQVGGDRKTSVLLQKIHKILIENSSRATDVSVHW